MPERNEPLGIIPSKEQLRFARRYLYSGTFRNETWQEYLARGIEEHVVDYIDSMSVVIDRSQAMNFQKWPIDRRDYNEIVLFSTYQEGIDYLKSFLHTHCAYLTKTFAKAAEEKAKAESKVQEQAQELQRLRDENKALRERYEKAHKELCRVRDEQKTIGKIKVNTNF